MHILFLTPSCPGPPGLHKQISEDRLGFQGSTQASRIDPRVRAAGPPRNGSAHTCLWGHSPQLPQAARSPGSRPTFRPRPHFLWALPIQGLSTAAVLWQTHSGKTWGPSNGHLLLRPKFWLNWNRTPSIVTPHPRPRLCKCPTCPPLTFSCFIPEDALSCPVPPCMCFLADLKEHTFPLSHML